MAKKICKKNVKKADSTSTLDTVPVMESTVEESKATKSVEVMRWSFITTLDNIQLAPDLSLDKLKTIVYECDAVTLEEALGNFISAAKTVFPQVATDNDLVHVFKVMFGKRISVLRRPVNNDEYDYVDL